MTTKYYGVKVGRHPGVYKNWEDCRKEVDGFPGAKHKSFPTEKEAHNYVLGKEDCTVANILPAAKTKGFSLKPIEKKEIPEFTLKPHEAVAYVDGSYTEKVGIPTFGIVLITETGIQKESGFVTDQDWYSMRKVAGEIAGAMKAMNMAVKQGMKKLTIYHDYKGIGAWCKGVWQAEKNGPIKYKEYYNKCSRVMDIRFVKVAGHSGDYYNNLADSLAGNVKIS